MLSLLWTHFDNAVTIGRKNVKNWRELIPRQQFDIKAGSYRIKKSLPEKPSKQKKRRNSQMLWRGDISRKRKLLEKQKKSKKE